MREIRGNRISMIFQEPMTSLNPVLTVGRQIAETVQVHQKVSRAQAMERAVEMLRVVQIPEPERRAHEYPHQLSGGMRQRVMIALALACNPELLIADEPTTALDVTIQAQILDLLKRLQKDLGMGVVMITHDLGVVAESCDRVVVMYAGRKVEEAGVVDLFDRPLHPYTRALMASMPAMNTRSRGCRRFRGWCPRRTSWGAAAPFAARCARERPLPQQAPQLVDAGRRPRGRLLRGRRTRPHAGDGGRGMTTTAAAVAPGAQPAQALHVAQALAAAGQAAIQAVDGVSFSVARGETLSLVGESGCGKTTTAKSVLRWSSPPRAR
jgi:oligopeptide/dipeptide ABC transporter ATP-binding protein